MDAHRRVNDDDVRLKRWRERDRPLLDLENTSGMTRYLGGVWTRTELDQRHRRLVDGGRRGAVRAFRILIEHARVPAGAVVFWRSGEGESATAEMGWVVYRAHQGRGIATAAARRGVQTFLGDRAFGEVGALHAYPRVDNVPSNAVARSAGFELVGPLVAPYRGQPFHVNDWRISR